MLRQTNLLFGSMSCWHMTRYWPRKSASIHFLPSNLAGSLNEIWCQISSIALKFNMRVGSITAEALVKFQSVTTSIALISRLRSRTRYHDNIPYSSVITRGPGYWVVTVGIEIFQLYSGYMPPDWPRQPGSQGAAASEGHLAGRLGNLVVGLRFFIFTPQTTGLG